MGIENVEMWVIKWEKFWNDNREKKNGERERQRQMIFTKITSNALRRAKLLRLQNQKKYN